MAGWVGRVLRGRKGEEGRVVREHLVEATGVLLDELEHLDRLPEDGQLVRLLDARELATVSAGDPDKERIHTTHRRGRLSVVELVSRLQAEPFVSTLADNILQRGEPFETVKERQHLVFGVRKKQGLLKRAEGETGPRLQRQEPTHPAPDGHQPPDLLRGQTGWS